METKTKDWSEPARRGVEYIAWEMMPAHRGVVDLTSEVGVLVAFGNDGYQWDAKSQRSVASVRRFLTSTGHGEEISFNVSHDGYTWMLLIAPGEGVNGLAELLDGIVWDGWLSNPDPTEVHFFRELQSAIAAGEIEQHWPALADCLA